MHRRVLQSVSVFLLFLSIGCQNKQSRRLDPSPKAPQIGLKTLAELNQGQTDLLAAVAMAFPKTENLVSANVGFFDDEKVAKMHSKLDPEKGNCLGHWVSNDETNYEDLLVKAKPSKPCPVQLSRYWSEEAAGSDRVWTFSTRLSVHDAEFMALLPIYSYDGKGDIHVTQIEGGTRFAGHVSFSNLKVAGYQDADMTMDFSQVKEGNSFYTGVVSLRIILDGHVGTGTIQWNSESEKVMYTVNGAETDPKVFDDAFSSFALDKVMARLVDLL
jgi:hypothetical protein